MKGWVTDRFTGYDLAGHLAVAAPDCAAWLTGQSSFRHSALSPDQVLLLEALGDLGYSVVRGGFPYNRAALTVPYRGEPLLPASLRNAAQYLTARSSQRFGAEVARHLRPLVERTQRRLLLLCGSCGTELLAAALPLLRIRPEQRVLAVALGPVGRRPAADRVLVHVIRGERDRLSRWGHRAPQDTLVPGGHLDYARSAEVRAEVLRVARKLLG